VVSVVAAVERELEPLPSVLREGALAAAAVALAEILDDGHNSATSRSMVAKELRETLSCLRALAPPKREQDTVDEIAAAREKRRASAGGAASADL
jgi:hypothetical protein